MSASLAKDKEHLKIENKGEMSSITFKYEELSSDDEIYTFQCPELFDKNLLLGKNFNHNDINQMQSNESFHIEYVKNKKKHLALGLPLASGKGSLVMLPLKGHIYVRKVLKKTAHHKPCYSKKNDSKVKFPTNIKTRHPLLGANWKDCIEKAEKAIKQNVKRRKKLKAEKKNKDF